MDNYFDTKIVSFTLAECQTFALIYMQMIPCTAVLFSIKILIRHNWSNNLFGNDPPQKKKKHAKYFTFVWWCSSCKSQLGTEHWTRFESKSFVARIFGKQRSLCAALCLAQFFTFLQHIWMLTGANEVSLPREQLSSLKHTPIKKANT